MNKIVFGLPKGSLEDATKSLLKKAGFTVTSGPRSYLPNIDDEAITVRLIRAQEISNYVQLGLLDAGITGYDWITENQSDVQEVADLVYAKQGMKPVRWVLAVPESSPIRSVADLQGKRIATEAVGLARQYLARHNVQATVEFSWGATEVKAPELVDAIIELTETGNSLRANNLRIVDTVLVSTTKLIANRSSWQNPWKRQKIEQISLLMQGALTAESRVLLKLNVAAENLDKIVGILPALHAPTVNALATGKWHSVETVMEERQVRDIIPRLKAAGAEGLIELSLNKVIP
jgi:ATP phosphoribosyltransferase